MSAAGHNPRKDHPKGRVAVAMSGGVDSSTAAALLVEQGYEVVGVHLKLHDMPDAEKRDKSCCSLDDALDARQVCARLDIPFYVLDFSSEFSRNVIDYFVDSYRAGLTPNPCVMCNKTVKSELLLHKVREFGCEFLATGHYAKVHYNADAGRHELLRPADRKKDQTYFLFATPAEELPHLLFPLADLDKPTVRRVAGRHGFLTWDKPDSQEVCFVPRDYRDFLRSRPEQTGAEPGPILNLAGQEVGRHAGLPFYTVGQRRGLGITGPSPSYVTALDPSRNAVVVGPEDALYSGGLIASGVNWVSCDPPREPLRAEVKVRYAHQGVPATLTPVEGGIAVEFDEPVRAVTPGQAAVFYRGDVVLGGGWIEAPAVEENQNT